MPEIFRPKLLGELSHSVGGKVMTKSDNAENV